MREPSVPTWDSPALTLTCLWRRLDPAAQQPGRAGREGRPKPFAVARVRWSDPKRRLLASDGCVRPHNAESQRARPRLTVRLSSRVRSLRKRRRPCSAPGPDGRRAHRPVGRSHHGLRACWGIKQPEGIKQRTHVRRDQPARARRRRWAKQRGAHVYIQEARQSRRGHDPLDAADLL